MKTRAHNTTGQNSVNVRLDLFGIIFLIRSNAPRTVDVKVSGLGLLLLLFAAGLAFWCNRMIGEVYAANRTKNTVSVVSRTKMLHIFPVAAFTKGTPQAPVSFLKEKGVQ